MRTTTLLLLGIGSSLALTATSPARASDEICDRAFEDTVFAYTVVVPDGAVCTLGRSEVKGDVKVLSGGALVTSSVQVRGNIQSDEGRFISLSATRVDGNVQIKKTFGLPPGLDANPVCGLQIGSDLQLDGNREAFDIGCVGSGNRIGGNLQITDSIVPGGGGEAIAVIGNVVNGDLQFKNNIASGRPFSIVDNSVRQNLQCFDNSPGPIGAGNVAGNAEGQCASLAVPRSGGNGGGTGGGFGGGEDFICVAAIERGRYENVIVPDGAACTLTRAQVRGTIKVSTRGLLVLDRTRVAGNVQVAFDGALDASGAVVDGSIQTDEAAWVQILRTKVRGNVQIDKTAGIQPSGAPNRICSNTIGGSLQVTKNTAPFELGCTSGNKVRGNLQVVDNTIGGAIGVPSLAVARNDVRGDLQFQNNQSSGTFDISNNRIRQNLQCVDNTPSPIGIANRAGDLEGQCSGLGR